MKDFNSFIESSRSEYSKIAEETLQSVIGNGGRMNLTELATKLITVSDELALERLRLHHERLHSYYWQVFSHLLQITALVR